MLAFALAVVVAVSPKSELHVVAVYESTIRAQGQKVNQPVVVQVNRPGKDVTLVLSAYEPTRWDVIVGKGSNVTRVILCGYHTQKTEVPKGVEVVEMFYEGGRGRGQKWYLYPRHSTEPPLLRPIVQGIYKFTGLEIASYQGMYNYDVATPFVVGTVKNDERLRSDYPRVIAADQLPKVSFRANHFAPQPGGGFTPAYGGFTQAGPYKQSVRPLPQGIFRATYDPGAKQYYGIGLHEIHSVDLENGQSEKIDLGMDVPKLSHPGPITFDSKRGRLLVPAQAGLYEYTPSTKKWAIVTEKKPGTTFAGLTYHSKTDTLFALGHTPQPADRMPRPILLELNHQGTIQKTTELGGALLDAAVSQYGFDEKVQLLDAGDYIAALIYRENFESEFGERRKGENFLFLIDPKTGKVQLAWKE